MMETSMGHLLQDMDYEVIGASDVERGAEALASLEVQGCAYSSLQVEPGDAFFCVPGLKHDGHEFASDAVARGAAALVVEHRVDADAPQYVVKDARRALACASARFYGIPSERLSLAGITGTNGKTTTTYLVEWVARALGHVTGLIGTVETRVAGVRETSHNTTPESLDLERLLHRMVESQVEYAVMEVSSHAISLDRVAGVRFQACGFSNLTQDHLDYHKDMEHYFQAKAALFHPCYCSKAAICVDDDYGRRLNEQCASEGMQVITCGFDQAADIHPRDISYHAHATDLTVVTPEGEQRLEFPLIGRFNVENLMLACALCHHLGFGYVETLAALEHAPQVPGRLERVMADHPEAAARQDFSVFVDYSHTPDSIEKALGALRPLTRGSLIIVFGCGGDRDHDKRPKMGRAATAADHVVVTSDNPRTEDPDAIIAGILPGLEGYDAFDVEPDRRLAIRRAIQLAKSGDTVLIAGKGHEDYQLVEDKVLAFDDRVVAAEELTRALGRASDDSDMQD